MKMAKISFSIFIDSLHSELALRFCFYTAPYIFLYKLTQASPTHSVVSHIFSKTLFSLVSSLVFFSSLFLIVYLSLIFFLSLYYFLRATSLDLIYFLIFLLMLKGLLHTEAMELINGTISAHREELLGFLSRYDAVRSDKYLQSLLILSLLSLC